MMYEENKSSSDNKIYSDNKNNNEDDHFEITNFNDNISIEDIQKKIISCKKNLKVKKQWGKI